MPTQMIFGERQFIPDDVLSPTNALVVFHKISPLAVVCSSVTISGNRPVMRMIDLTSMGAVAHAGVFIGKIEMVGIITVKKNWVDLLRAYSDICDPRGNDISIIFTSPCVPGSTVRITAHGAVIDGIAIGVSEKGGGASLSFVVHGLSISAS